MANTSCLIGPPFSLIGSTIYLGRQAACVVGFDSPADQAEVLAYEWYLDQALLLDHNQPDFNAVVNCGSHTLSVRLLTGGGWSGLKSLSIQTCRSAASIGITGPASVNEGSSVAYSVIASFSDGSSADVSGEYAFSCPDGSFSGQVFTAAENSVTGDTRSSVITATREGSQPLTRTITILDGSENPPLGVLVVDFFDDTGLDVAAVIDNPEVAGNNTLCYTGHNFLPVTTAQNALILASDPVTGQVLTRRFQFNIAKLVTDYPATTVFTMIIRGRSTTAGRVDGSYSAKSPETVMQMSGSPGSHVPGVTGGSDAISPQPFSSHVVDGADGNFNEGTLRIIVEFSYQVTDRIVTMTTV